MGYAIGDVVSFYAVKGDHLDTLKANPALVKPGSWEAATNPDPVKPDGSVVYEDLVRSTEPDNDGLTLVAVADGWTFIGIPDEFDGSELALHIRLARKLASDTFMLTAPDQYNPCSFMIVNADGTVLRYRSPHEQNDDSDMTEIGEPIPYEDGIPELWTAAGVARVFAEWGGPSFPADEDFDRSFKKSCWLRYTGDDADIGNDPEIRAIRDQVNALEHTVPDDDDDFTDSEEDEPAPERVRKKGWLRRSFDNFWETYRINFVLFLIVVVIGVIVAIFE